MTMQKPDPALGIGLPGELPTPGAAKTLSQKSNSATSSNTGTPPIAIPKVAIPRQPTVAAASGYGRRVPRACESCRQRKTKCSGDTPACRQCRELRVDCSYPVSWKEKTQKDLDRVSTKASDYEGVLKDIGDIVDGRTSARIRDILQKHSSSDENSPQSNPTAPTNDSPDQDETSSQSSMGSLDAIDRVDEDLNRSESTRATGYMGKNSEVTWMQRLRREAEQRSQKEPGTYEPRFDSAEDADFALTSVNYHLDDMEISVPWPVQMYWIPPRQLADQLFEDYLNTVHPFFPIISRPLFCAQYKNFFDNAPRPGDKWLAILNLIFAISAKHAHLVQAPWRGNDYDHLEYLTRARMLSMNGDVIFSHPDLQQVQVEGLISFYLLASDQINRSWRIASLAVRSAVTLGINLRSTSEGTTNVSKEARYRVWWCLYCFEHMLGIMTGRATCILDGVCTSPLPFPYEEEDMSDPMALKLLNNTDLRQELVAGALASVYVHQMPPNPVGGKEAKHTDKPRDTAWLRNIPVNQGLCFLYYTDLAVITQEIVNKVYSMDCTMVPWSHIENRIGELRSRIDLWHANLPDAFKFTHQSDGEPDSLREKLFLAFHYYSARITLGRPCLCRRDAKQEVADQRHHETFSHQIAVITLESSLRMLDLIPDEPDATRLYQICPWWSILHFLMQATTVLLLELSFGTMHMPEEEMKFLDASKKGIRWFYTMSGCSVASRRAWQLCDSNLRRIATGMNYDVSDMPVFVYEPKPDHPIDVNYQASGVPTTAPVSRLSFAPSDITWNPAQDISQFNLAELSTVPAVSMSSEVPVSSGSAYFPYDPIGGDFIRTFFPATNEHYPWDHSVWGPLDGPPS